LKKQKKTSKMFISLYM